MSSRRREPDQPRGHVFDGIFEYDNDLPVWWVALFIITIAFSGGYLLWYHTGLFPAQSLADEYEADANVAKIEAQQRAVAQANAPFAYAAAAKDPTIVTTGKDAYQSTCAPCHGVAGQGIVGPNLTDDFWIHGRTGTALETIIAKGALEKGMPAWQEILGTEKIRHTIAYIYTLQGTNPPEAKAPQGEAGKLE